MAKNDHPTLMLATMMLPASLQKTNGGVRWLGDPHSELEKPSNHEKVRHENSDPQ